MTRQATRLRTQRPLPGTHLSLACAVGAAAAVTPYLSAYSRWRSSEALCNLPHRLTGGNATRDLFALVEPQCYQSSPAWRRSNSSIESQDPIDTALVPPLKRSGDVRHTLTALPAFPKFSLLLRREPCPCIPFHAHTSSSRMIRRCCVERLNPQGIADIRRSLAARRSDANGPNSDSRPEPTSCAAQVLTWSWPSGMLPSSRLPAGG